jgi:hypothetical protein
MTPYMQAFLTQSMRGFLKRSAMREGQSHHPRVIDSTYNDPAEAGQDTESLILKMEGRKCLKEAMAARQILVEGGHQPTLATRNRHSITRHIWTRHCVGRLGIGLSIFVVLAKIRIRQGFLVLRCPIYVTIRNRRRLGKATRIFLTI